VSLNQLLDAVDGMGVSEIAAVLKQLEGTSALEEVEAMLAHHKETVAWAALPGPQTRAFDSAADVLGYGGAAGGGKTDLACGAALVRHKKTMIMRREATQLTGIIDRLTELIGSRQGYNGSDKIWRLPGGRQIEFGSTPNPGDETKYQGRPRDLLVLDEAANFLEIQARFLMGWVRTTDPTQRCQTMMCFNPPTTAEGQWIIEYFGPWLQAEHPNPARPGGLRWFATYNGEDHEVADNSRFMFEGEEIIPQSRTFIPSKIRDNPFLVETGYMATLQALPEPLRSQMLKGDFLAGMEDDPWQMIPTAWVMVAQDRWKERKHLNHGPMISMGVDVSRGGRDSTIIMAKRPSNWFDEPIKLPGEVTVNGPAVAGKIIVARRNGAPVHVDGIGPGTSVVDSLDANKIQVISVIGSCRSYAHDHSGRLGFTNLRGELYWRMREALDPQFETGICLPPSARLRADLCAPTFEVVSGNIKIEPKEKLCDRIGRSPDEGDACVLSNIDTPVIDPRESGDRYKAESEYDPYA